MRIPNSSKVLKTSALTAAAGALLVAMPSAASAHGYNYSHSSYSQNPSAYYQHRDGDSRVKFASSTRTQHRANMSNQEFVDYANAKLNKLNATYTKIQNFVSTNNLSVNNYAALTTKLNADQAAAAGAIASIDISTGTDLGLSNDSASVNSYFSGSYDMRKNHISPEVVAAIQALNTYQHDLAKLSKSVLSAVSVSFWNS